MKKNIGKFFIILLVSLLVLSSCGAKNEGALDNRFDGFDASSKVETAEPELKDEAAGSIMDSENRGENTTITDGRKIIETRNLMVQTKEFDTLISNIKLQISTLGGYIENSSVNGREFDSTRNRSATFTIRIPASKTNEFAKFVSENSVVTNESISTKDVTLTYVDMESRVSALEAEKAALEKLLDNAATMTDIVSVRNKLTDVIYEIESYKSQLRTYDNLIEYSTVIISIYEVERTVIVEKQTTWEKIGTNLKTNFENVWLGCVNVFIFIISAIPYLIPIALGLTIVVIIIRAKIKKKKSAKASTNTEEN